MSALAPTDTVAVAVDTDALTHGALRVEGQLTAASNATLLCTLVDTGGLCVYKPQAGERELWDFPTGTLGKREVAAYQLDRLLGWGLVPETVWRWDGPFGAGMCQRWLDGVPDVVQVTSDDGMPSDWIAILRGQDEAGAPVTLCHANRDDLMRIAIFDAIVNNADRKGGHLLRDDADAVWAIDHGLTFAEDSKLRTVLWGWVGAPIPADALEDIQRIRDGRDLRVTLHDLLTDDEVDALHHRIEAVLERGTFPEPSPHWPAVPWPVL